MCPIEYWVEENASSDNGTVVYERELALAGVLGKIWYRRRCLTCVLKDWQDWTCDKLLRGFQAGKLGKW